MINDTIKVTGELKLTLTNPDGNTHETVIPNIVVTDGKEYIASRMKDASATAMSHMAIGTGSTAAAARRGSGEYPVQASVYLRLAAALRRARWRRHRRSSIVRAGRGGLGHRD